MPEPGWLNRTHVITTPEAVDFSYDLAGGGHRALAWSVDAAIIGILSVLLAMNAVFVSQGVGAYFILFSFFLQVGYFTFFEVWWAGQTPGKKLAGIRALDARGFRMTFSQAATRNLFRLFDSLPAFYLLGGLTTLLNRRGLRFGDLAAGTVVVRIPYVPTPERLLPAGQRSDALLADFVLGERVRRVLRSPEKDLLVSLAVRRGRLEERSRQRLFESTAAWFSQRLEIPRPSTMSAETYVLNLAAIAHTAPVKQGGAAKR
ncbi:MAG: RDD family protein [Planctomycetes bacterium]|nr:RDD family protein [Planctomycetota bacterium]